MENARIKKERIPIRTENVKDFYSKRAREKSNGHVDAPAVLCGDRDPSKIQYWTNYELEHNIVNLRLDEASKVLELGFGTGRISKYLIQGAGSYVGIDYVDEFVDLANSRNDIEKDKNCFFIKASFYDIMMKNVLLPVEFLFNRFVVSGGVMMYINDAELRKCILHLADFFDHQCILYISEPVAIEERLTLKDFYSEELHENYNAIYRTVAEYNDLFTPLYRAGFVMKKSEPFFSEDIKGRKETKQWLFVMERG